MDKNLDINQIEFQQEERIMTYLRGKMSHEEEGLFMEDLQKDPELKDKAISMAHLAKGMSEIGADNDKNLKESFMSSNETTIKSIAKRVVEDKTAPVRSPFKKYATVLSLAASLLLVLYLGYQYYDYSQTTALGAEYATEYESSVARGSEQSDAEREVELLINNVYFNKDIGNSLKRLAVLWELSTMDTYNDYIEFAPQIGWALATGYLKENNTVDASIVLEKMAKLFNDDDVIYKKLRDLQEKIADL